MRPPAAVAAAAGAADADVVYGSNTERPVKPK